jgi:hypothetical protein
VVSYFEVYRCDPEASFDIPTLTHGDVPLQIRIAAAGGGTVGAAYANNVWIYEVRVAGTLVAGGADLRCGGLSRTHAQMAVVLAEHLAATDEVAALRRHRQRLGIWAYDTEPGDGRDG